jgi:hypothetical protein
MLVSPRCVVEARICGLVILVLSVFPNRILHLIRCTNLEGAWRVLLHL